MEFHEPTEEGSDWTLEPVSPTFQCETCGVDFSAARDLRVHTFEGHPKQRPVLVFKGRECGRSRLTITRATTEADWIIRSAQKVEVNGRTVPVETASGVLSAQTSGVVDVVLANEDLDQRFQFNFALADEDDLSGVDAALDRLIANGELSARTIDEFIMRSKPFRTAARYLAGLADYLYGVHTREKNAESFPMDASYEGKYDRAVVILGGFDRPPAEAICGIVAFHYNQFARAMTKTKSERVAEASLRFEAMLKGEPWLTRDFSASPHTSLDVVLSDLMVDQVLTWSSVPLDGSAADTVAEMESRFVAMRAPDELKLRLIAAEHHLAAGAPGSAMKHAEMLRHRRSTDIWYTNFRRRVEGES